MAAVRHGLPDLAAMAQIVISDGAGDHGLPDRHGTDADARIVPALGQDVDVLALRVNRAGAASGSMRSA